MRRLLFGIMSPLALVALSGCAAGMKEASMAPPAPPGGAYAIAGTSASTESSNEAPAEAGDSDSRSARPRVQAQMAYPQQPAATTPVPNGVAKPASPTGGAQAEAPSKQYLVYTADFTLAVYQVEIGLDRTEAIARELGGYLAMRGDHEITVRVPRDKFRDALAQVEKIGDVVHRDVKAIDVTDEFVDTESRLKNARVMRDRLQALLQKAAVKEALEIEKELGRVTEQIEVLEGKMKMLSDRIAFSTITVHYAAKGPGDARPNFHLPFVWVQSLGVHRLLNFQPKSE